jgi:hypothetical protein
LFDQVVSPKALALSLKEADLVQLGLLREPPKAVAVAGEYTLTKY